MAKPEALPKVQPPADGTRAQLVANASRKAGITYRFRHKQNGREFEVDALHLRTMVSRTADLEYIGDLPLPSNVKNNETRISV